MYSGIGVAGGAAGVVKLYPVGTGAPPLPLLLAAQVIFTNTGASTVSLQAGPSAFGLPVAAGQTITLGGNGGLLMDLSQIYVNCAAGATWAFFAV